jgi:hypothetical protein
VLVDLKLLDRAVLTTIRGERRYHRGDPALVNSDRAAADPVDRPGGPSEPIEHAGQLPGA